MKGLFTLVLSLITIAVMAQARASFDKTVHHFGTFNEGPDSTCVFTITNTGSSPLVIKNVSRPCGCTTPVFSTNPIQSGDSTTIVVKYSSAGHPGYFDKKLQVLTNDSEKDAVFIHIKGEVIPKELKTKDKSETETGEHLPIKD